MVRSQKILTVFLASPGDLDEERRFARDCVNEWNAVNAERTGWLVELLGWEDTLPQAGRPQALINRDVQRCLLFVGMMHRHWGSETGNGFTSGFREEFTLATTLYEANGSPRIALFFKHPGAINDPGDQLKQVLTFKDTIRASKKFLYKELQAEAETWQTGFRLNLHRTIFDTIDGLEIEADAPATEAPDPSDSVASSKVADSTHLARLSELRALLDRLAAAPTDTEAPVQDVARLRLMGASWKLPGLSEAHVGTHDANVILRTVESTALSVPEVYGLIDAGLASIASQTIPLWRWVAREDADLSFMKALSVWGDDDAVRAGGLKVLTWARTPLGFSMAHVAERFETATSQVRGAFYGYLASQDDPDSLATLLQEFGKADYKTEAPLVEALLLRLGRESAHAALRFLVIENISPPYTLRRQVKWDGLADFSDQDLRIAFRHRDAEVRAAAAIQLARRGALATEEKLALRDDASPSVRAASVQIALEGGEAISLADAERIVVRRARTKNALSMIPEGTQQHDAVRVRLLETFTTEALQKEADELYQPADDAYEILLRREWKDRVSSARREILGNFKEHFDVLIARRRAILGETAANLALPNDMALIYDFRAGSMIRAALNVIGEKGSKSHLPLFRHALTRPYFSMTERDYQFFGKHGEWSDIPGIANATRSSGGTLMAPEKIVAIKDVGAAIIRIAKGRERELVGLELPDVVRVSILKRLPRTVIVKLPDAVLLGLLNDKSDEVRRIAAVRCARDLTKARCKDLLERYHAQASYFYNVIHWLDLAVSMPRTIVEAVTAAQLLDD